MDAKDIQCPRTKCSAAPGQPCSQYAEGFGWYVVPVHAERWDAAEALVSADA